MMQWGSHTSLFLWHVFVQGELVGNFVGIEDKITLVILSVLCTVRISFSHPILRGQVGKSDYHWRKKMSLKMSLKVTSCPKLTDSILYVFVSSTFHTEETPKAFEQSILNRRTNISAMRKISRLFWACTIGFLLSLLSNSLKTYLLYVRIS